MVSLQQCVLRMDVLDTHNFKSGFCWADEEPETEPAPAATAVNVNCPEDGHIQDHATVNATVNATDDATDNATDNAKWQTQISRRARRRNQQGTAKAASGGRWR